LKERRNFMSLANQSGPLLRAELRSSSEKGFESIETGMLDDHFSAQKHSMVELTYEEQFTSFSRLF
jgi:hypothetical protein